MQKQEETKVSDPLAYPSASFPRFGHTQTNTTIRRPFWVISNQKMSLFLRVPLRRATPRGILLFGVTRWWCKTNVTRFFAGETPVLERYTHWNWKKRDFLKFDNPFELLWWRDWELRFFNVATTWVITTTRQSKRWVIYLPYIALCSIFGQTTIVSQVSTKVVWW